MSQDKAILALLLRGNSQAADCRRAACVAQHSGQDRQCVQAVRPAHGAIDQVKRGSRACTAFPPRAG